MTESAESSEEKDLHKEGITQEDPCPEHQELLGDLWDVHLKEHKVPDLSGLMLSYIAGNRRDEDGRKPDNDDTVAHTYLMKENE